MNFSSKTKEERKERRKEFGPGHNGKITCDLTCLKLAQQEDKLLKQQEGA